MENRRVRIWKVRPLLNLNRTRQDGDYLGGVPSLSLNLRNGRLFMGMESVAVMRREGTIRRSVSKAVLVEVRGQLVLTADQATPMVMGNQSMHGQA